MTAARRLLLLACCHLLAAATARAQVGSAPGRVEPNTATPAELARVPHLTPALVDAIVKGRPWLSMRALDSALATALTPAQRGETYGTLFLHLNLNAATREEIALIPGLGRRMIGEFLEYRPYRTLAQFQREMRKYVDDAEVARLTGYVFVPIDLNTATDDVLRTIPGLGTRMLGEFKEYRPYRTMAQFRREMGKYVPATEVARLERYVELRPAAR